MASSLRPSLDAQAMLELQDRKRALADAALAEAAAITRNDLLALLA